MGVHRVGLGVRTWHLRTGRRGHSERGNESEQAGSVWVSEKAGVDRQRWGCCTGESCKLVGWGKWGW